MRTIVFFDTEINPQTGRVLDIGAVRQDGAPFHTESPVKMTLFLRGASYLCGHNIFAHDLPYIGRDLMKAAPHARYIDTLLLSPLLFPQKPYHRLLKDDKLRTEERSNPVNDARKAQALFYDEINAFLALPAELGEIYISLLAPRLRFSGFFHYLGRTDASDPVGTIRSFFHGKLCEHAPLEEMVREHPVELAYALALIHTGDKASITPPWVVRNPCAPRPLSVCCSPETWSALSSTRHTASPPGGRTSGWTISTSETSSADCRSGRVSASRFPFPVSQRRRNRR